MTRASRLLALVLPAALAGCPSEYDCDPSFPDRGADCNDLPPVPSDSDTDVPADTEDTSDTQDTGDTQDTADTSDSADTDTDETDTDPVDSADSADTDETDTDSDS